ncbi:MAG TPA: DNA polymerase I [Steroidobacteraceae bacterium]|jgi:DNA polymerase-1|nr:DNA polymerase I [Steroidobacteraceae bacterium]
MTRSPDLVLVDGSSYVYRAFHAAPAVAKLTTARGEPTGAMLVVLNMLNKLVKDFQPARIAIVFDAPGRTFRDELFAEYKAQRPGMPDELRAQVGPLLAMIQAQGLPLLREPGVEADDVIGTLACRAARAGQQVLISTGDKDMAQLVNESITLINTMTDSRLDREGVKAKFDVYPEQMIDYLALIGDSSDNIPGIDKVGPKTGAKLLQQFGSLDQLVAQVESIPGRIGENLRQGLSTLELSRRLATIRTDLDLALSLEELTPKPPDVATLRELYARYELRALQRALEGEGASTAGAAAAPPPSALPAPPVAPPDERRYETITRWEDFERWLVLLEAAELFAFDTETTTLDYMRAEIVGVSFSVEPGVAAYVPLAHVYPGAPEQLARARVLGALKPLLEDGSRGKIGHDLKYDAHVLAHAGITLAGMRFDTMLESYVCNSVATNHDLDADAQRYLGVATTRYADVAGKGAKQISFDQVSVERATEYAAENADMAVRLHRALWPQLEAVPGLARLYEECERPLLPVLVRMEQHGVLIDREQLRAQSREFARDLQEILLAAHREAGHEFNIESPRQLQQILFERLQLPVRRRTPTGQPSTAEDVLEELAASYALPRLVLEYRALAKLKSTYTDKLPELVNERTGRIHTSYAQAVAATGRLSSVDPNLQNIPVRRVEGRRIRQAFVAPPGHVLLAADYSQIELRIMAHLSGDETLRAAFADNRDVHQATAAEVFGCELEAVSDDQRRTAKVINFGLIYGMSAFGLARNLGIERSAAQRYVERYFQRYPGVRRFMDNTRTQAREMGYVETVFGRRLYLPDIRSGNPQLRQYAERSAINAPMQGTAADIIKRAMIEVDAWLTRERLPARLIMQVHDELVLEAAHEVVATVSAAVHDCMANAAQLSVPLRVDVGTGANWDEAH